MWIEPVVTQVRVSPPYRFQRLQLGPVVRMWLAQWTRGAVWHEVYRPTPEAPVAAS